MNLKIIIPVFLSFFLYGPVFGQFSTTNKDDEFLYRHEFAAGVNFNTNGGLIGGVMFKYARAISSRWYHSFTLDMVNVKHPKENRYQNIFTGSTFIPGKQNYLYIVRPMYGRELVLFKKAREQGIQVNALAAIGPSIGVVAPYLIQYEFSNGQVRVEQYDPNRHQIGPNIIGTGSFTESLSQASLELGAAMKLSMSFEFGTFKNNVTGFESGIMLDYYRNDVVIIPLADNRSVYSSIFLTFFFGFRK